MFENYKTFTYELAGRPLTVEVGKVAGLANGSCLVRYGDTAVLACATASARPRVDDLPARAHRISAQGRGGGPGNMQSMLKQAQKMQEDMAALQEDLDAREYEVAAGGGAVKIKINGKLEVSGVEIDPDVVDPDDVETLQDILTAAMNEAIRKVNDTNNEEMGKITGSLNMGGLGMPGLF